MNTKTPKKQPTILKPAPLHPGKAVAVISPAGPADENHLNAGVRELERWGYRVKVGEHTRGRIAYFSGSDQERLEDLLKAFSDPSVQAVFCSRGGYGSARLLEMIPYDFIAENPRIFVGFSDLSALNWAFFARARLVTFTGPLVTEIGEGLPDSTIRGFLNMIRPGRAPDTIWRGDWRAVRPGEASGPLFPGCLAIIVTLLGTPFLPDLEGAILLIEEIGEKPYQVDRMLTHLKNSGTLDQIAGLLVGRMINCWPKSRRGHHLSLEEILLDLTASNPIPIYTGLPYGHHLDRLTLPVGVNVEISEKEGLRLLEDPLARSNKA